MRLGFVLESPLNLENNKISTCTVVVKNDASESIQHQIRVSLISYDDMYNYDVRKMCFQYKCEETAGQQLVKRC